MNVNGEIIELKVSSEDVKRVIDADTAEVDGIIYHMLLMLDENDQPDGRFMVEKELERSGKIELVPVDDAEEYDEISDMFIARQNLSAIEDMVDEDGMFEFEDENGNPQRFEWIDTAEFNGTIYHAVIPASDDGDEVESFVVLKQITDDEGITLTTIDNDEEYDAVGEIFLKRFSELDDEEDEDEE